MIASPLCDFYDCYYYIFLYYIHLVGPIFFILPFRKFQRWNMVFLQENTIKNPEMLIHSALKKWLYDQGDQGDRRELDDQDDQGDRREQDDQGELSIIIFGMSESSRFQKYGI